MKSITAQKPIGSVLQEEPSVKNASAYDHLPALNPDDLKLPSPPPSAADKVTNSSEAISFSEVWQELKAKTKEIIIGASVGTLIQTMRGINISFGCCMILIAVAQLLASNSAFSAMSEMLGACYTIMFGIMLILYEIRTPALDVVLRQNYGFMYNPRGRCLFLCMISIFPVGMLGVYGMLVSLIGFSNAYFNYFVITKHPSFTRGVPDYVPPSTTSAVDCTEEVSAAV